MTKSNQQSFKKVLSDTHSRYLSIIATMLVILTTVTSLIGLIFPDKVYDTRSLQLSFVPNDVINLVIVVPVMIVLIIYSHRRYPSAILSLLGLLWYHFYIYTIYILGTRISILTLNYFVISAVAMYTVIWLLQVLRTEQILSHKDSLSTMYVGALFTLVGLVFLIRQVVEIVNAVTDPNHVSDVLLGQWYSDMIIFCIPLLVGGISLLRSIDLGVMLAPGLLLSTTISFLGLVPFLIIQAMIEGETIDWMGILIVTIFGLPLLVPYLRYLRNMPSH